MQKILPTIALLLLFINLQAQNPPNIVITQFATGFSLPVDIQNCGDDRLFIVQQRGLIRILNSNGTINSSSFLNISSLVNATGNERGLLGMAFHPNYKNNGYFYVNYTRASDGATRISRFSRNPANPDDALDSSEYNILTIPQPYNNHNGGQIVFGPEGYLYIGMGDGGGGGDPDENGQDPQELLGKMLRIDVDNGAPYSIPDNNPFFGSPSVRNEIWALGLRNPWRFSFDRLTGDMWIGDVGQSVHEEINFEPAGDAGGHNYGWDCYEGNQSYEPAGCIQQSTYTFPICDYTQTAANGCSVTGGFVYRGGIYGGMHGWYIFADYCSGRFWGIYPNGSGGWDTSVLKTNIKLTYTIGSFGENHLGELYMAGTGNGRIYKISDTACLPTAFIEEGDLTICKGDTVSIAATYGEGNTYLWSRNDTVIINATDNILQVAESGTYSVTVTNTQNCSNISTPITITTSDYPVVSFSGLNSSYQVNHSPSALIGTPSGGIFSGPGISGNTFNPSVAGVGNHQIIYCYADTIGCKSCDTNSTIVSAVSSLEAITMNRINLYPNPAKSLLNMDFYVSGKTDVSLQFFNTAGQLIKNEVASVNGGSIHLQTDISTFTNGVYLVQLKCETGIQQMRFVVYR